MNGDEAVTFGAVIEAALLYANNATAPQVRVQDMTPLSLGNDLFGRIMSVMILRNTRIHCQLSKTYTTSEDDQTEARIEVYQGQRKMIDDNLMLGELTADKIPAAARGVSEFTVFFKLNKDGILEVRARPVPGKPLQHLEIGDAVNLHPIHVNIAINRALQMRDRDKV